LLPSTEPVVSGSTFQSTQLASVEDLANQLNIEKRPAVGDSLLATTDILQVRPDVTDWPENYITDDTAVCCGVWKVGSQETAGTGLAEQDWPHVSERCDEPFEVDLDELVDNLNYVPATSLPVLDMAFIEDQLNAMTGHQLLAVERMHDISLLHTRPVEDELDCLLPASAGTYTPVPDTSKYQPPQVAFGLPNTTKYSISPYPLAAVATRPLDVVTGYRSMPESGVTASQSIEVQHLQSLPATMSKTMSASFLKQLPAASLSNQVIAAQKTATQVPQHRASSEHIQMVNSGPPPLPTLVANMADAKLIPSAAPVTNRVLSVLSPVGQITGTMGGLSIDNNHHPLLRGMLTEATHQTGAREQKKSTADQVTVRLYCFC